MKKIRWGIVGPGVIANKFARAIKNLDNAELSAVASRSIERGRAFAEKYEIDNVFGSYDEMARSPLVDAVYIATAHPFHKPCAEIFLNGGKHVLCEKPLCVNANQAKKLKALAEKNNLFLMEAMWTRYLPAVKELSRIVNEGEIGTLTELSADFCYALGENEDSKMLLNSMAGGALLDVGVYGLHFASIFFGNSAESIVAQSKLQDGVDLHTGVMLKYKNGEIAHVTSATDLNKPASAYLYGTDGYIFVPHFYAAQEFVIYKDGEERRVSMPSLGEGFEEEIIEACTCIAEGKTQSDLNPLDQSIAILSQMDYIRDLIGLKYPFD